jgi:hypothetical protein
MLLGVRRELHGDVLRAVLGAAVAFGFWLLTLAFRPAGLLGR